MIQVEHYFIISGYKLIVQDVLPMPDTAEDIEQHNKFLHVIRRFWHAPFVGSNAMYEAISAQCLTPRHITAKVLCFYMLKDLELCLDDMEVGVDIVKFK